MKKATLVILFCMGAVLLVHIAHAEEPGFGGEIVIGGGIVTGRLSQLDAEEGDRLVNRRNQRGDNDTYLYPYFGGELNYTLEDGRTTLFITDLKSDTGLAVGVRQDLGDLGRLSAAGTYGSRKVWKDPYLLGVPRSRTDETCYGVSVELEEIQGTNFLVTSNFSVVDVDKDRVGAREKNLRRDGFRSDHTLGYVIGLGENQLIIPMVNYARSDMDGKANSSDGVTVSIGYEWGKGPWGIEASAGIGWIDYRKDHPVFDRERRAKTFEATALVAYAEPFGWSKVSIYGLAAYSRVDENIDFFDQRLWTFGLGVAYEF